MNEALKNMMERRTCRSYKPEMIKDEELQQILTAGMYAPSGMGMQSPKFVVVQNPELVRKLGKMNAAIMGKDIDAFYGAPMVVIVFADSERPTYVEDGSLAMGNMLNAAASLGIGGCWIHRAKPMFESEEGLALMKEWGIPENYKGVAHCVLGYPASDPLKAKPRKEDYVVYVK